MYSDGLLKLPLFTIQKNFKILLTVYSLSPHFIVCFLSIFLRILLLRDLPLRIIGYDIPHVTCSHHLISDFEVGASCSMALQSQVSTSYPRVPRDFYSSGYGLFVVLSCTFCKDSFSLIHDVNCCIYITVHSVTAFTVINPIR